MPWSSPAFLYISPVFVKERGPSFPLLKRAKTTRKGIGCKAFSWFVAGGMESLGVPLLVAVSLLKDGN